MTNTGDREMAVLLSDFSRTGIMHQIGRLYGYNGARLTLVRVGADGDYVEEYVVDRNGKTIPGVKVTRNLATGRYLVEGKS